jgi:hypothetical protein
VYIYQVKIPRLNYNFALAKILDVTLACLEKSTEDFFAVLPLILSIKALAASLLRTGIDLIAIAIIIFGFVTLCKDMKNIILTTSIVTSSILTLFACIYLTY